VSLNSQKEKKTLMKFCESCGNILVVAKEKGGIFLFCKKCNKKFPLEEEVVFETNFKNQKEISVFDSEESDFPTTKILCPKCQTIEKAEWTLQQTRAADEPPTRFYRCKKCNWVWREYG
jgi:DNA-directed RNA polymerase subunit M